MGKSQKGSKKVDEKNGGAKDAKKQAKKKKQIVKVFASNDSNRNNNKKALNGKGPQFSLFGPIPGMNGSIQTTEKKKRKKTKKKKKEKKKPSHSFNLPHSNKFISIRGTPWFNCRDEHSPPPGPPGPPAHKRKRKLPSPSPRGRGELSSCPAVRVSEVAMSLLDSELEHFAAYVRLRAAEHRARTHVIQAIADQAGELFGEDIHLELFGSYASPELCMFSSDVDLALWGVVEPEEDELVNQHIRFEEEDYVIRDPEHQQQQREKQVKAREREVKIGRWRDAIAEQVQKQEVSEEKKDEEALEGSQTGVSAPLFELDTEGDNVTIDLTNDDDDDDDDEADGKPAPTGSEYTDAIEVIDSDSDDSANPLESLYSKQSTNRPIVEQLWEDKEDEEEEEEEADCEKAKDTMEVMYHANNDNRPTSAAVGPKGKTRRLVVNALFKLSHALRRRQPWLRTLEVRSRARVPIVNMMTQLGFESDLALGGHNGTDTSKFAAAQSKRFKSFSCVVLILKTLLNQQELDKPFTGGLGSYKLYIMLAYHIDQHLKHNGNDRPGEIFLTFLYRFRNATNSKYETYLHEHTVLSFDGYSAEMTQAFKLDACVTLFETCYTRLFKKMDYFVGDQSMLTCVVQHNLLQQERSKCLKHAEQLNRYARSVHSEGKKKGQGQSPDRYRYVRDPKPPPSFESMAPKRRTVSEDHGDANEDQLLRGYGVARGPRGGLIPRNRLDQQSAIEQMKAKLLKNRKNKRKQNRDKGIRAIAESMM